MLKFYGAYSLDWSKLGFSKNNQTEFQLFTTASSGSVLTTFVTISGIDFIPLTKRGDLGRTERFTQTDFALRHRYQFGQDDRFTLVMEADVLNLFNEANELNRNNVIDATVDYTVINPAYGLITTAQEDACNSSGNKQPCFIALS